MERLDDESVCVHAVSIICGVTHQSHDKDDQQHSPDSTLRTCSECGDPFMKDPVKPSLDGSRALT